jgi:2'-5' RNA ligase
MVEITANSPLLSVHILLPEAVDRRLERWTQKMPGTSWPAWGGHVTLVPNFVPLGSPDEVIAAIEGVCAQEQPFVVRFAAPIAVQDSTRPGYFAVFLTVEEMATDSEGMLLPQLRSKLLLALDALREDVRPQLIEQAFLPHVTLALGLGESEANKLVREIRAEPLTAEFKVDVIWLVTQSVGNGTRFDRHPIALGPIAPIILARE